LRGLAEGRLGLLDLDPAFVVLQPVLQAEDGLRESELVAEGARIAQEARRERRIVGAGVDALARVVAGEPERRQDERAPLRQLFAAGLERIARSGILGVVALRIAIDLQQVFRETRQRGPRERRGQKDLPLLPAFF